MNCVLSSLIALLALTPTQAPRAEDSAALVRADELFCRDTQEHGLDGWMSWFAEDALILAHAGDSISGLEAARKYYASLAFPPPGFSWAPGEAVLAESGDLGFTVGSYEIRGTESARPVLQSGSYLTVWQRQADGGYKVVVDSGGRTDFRTRVEELPGPPLMRSYTAERSKIAKSGELAFTAGKWTAKAEEAATSGKYLSFWKRTEDGAWEVVAETGFDH
jgi:ketosteroid isomerase-like protein